MPLDYNTHERFVKRKQPNRAQKKAKKQAETVKETAKEEKDKETSEKSQTQNEPNLNSTNTSQKKRVKENASAKRDEPSDAEDEQKNVEVSDNFGSLFAKKSLFIAFRCNCYCNVIT